MATASQPTDQPADQPDSSALKGKVVDALAAAFAPPSPADFRLYAAHASGKSIADLAKSAGAGAIESDITSAIERVRIDNERYSAARAGVEARKLFFSLLPKISDAFSAALTATRMHGKKVVMIDKQTGEAVTMEETVERPDHAIRLQAIDSSRFILSVVQPKDPAVSIISNSQTNILNQAALPVGGGLGLKSPEDVIRQVVAARQHALNSENPITSKIEEGEVIEARVGLGSDPDEDDLEAEPDEGGEDEDSEDDGPVEDEDE